MLKKIAAGLLVILLLIFTWLVVKVFPAISGYGAKNMCSAIYLQHREVKEILKEDLSAFPVSLGSYEWNEKDSSVTGSVWGFAKRKAIFRAGIGATLVNDFTEAQVKAQTFFIPPPPAVNTDSVSWPYGDQLNDTVFSSLDTGKLNLAVEHALNATNNNSFAYTRAVLVVYDGKIVAERYAPGFDKHTVMLGWSMSKSLTAAMIGILVKEGKLHIDASAPVPEWKGTGKEKITLKNLLQQSSGLDFTEIYDRPSDVTTMLFSTGDMAAYAAARRLEAAPGKVFNYTSGNSNILSRIIRHTVGEKTYAAFPYTQLFYKINAYSFKLEPDASGTYIGSSYSYGTARDFARFGLLYYNNGTWNGEKILPDGWVAATRQPCAANTLHRYGYQFWINGLDETDTTKKRFNDVPADLYFCGGFGGQGVYIIPSKKLVVVRMGLKEIDRNIFLKEIIAAIRE